ncbi:hypothetical protein [Ligilactobacillus acidipiscis]|uniref:hypothetical protein n=1 Tax=Ligilactobacillus acidipiscis TaxID=89059 RepID=UPI0029F8D19B|nr:hypothetical protein [Ligilactobacillus acidipiscis]MCI1953823.1 hypothetical protein [Ligilactobacillus acidipiscis]
MMQAIGLAAIVVGIHTVIKSLDKCYLPILFIIGLAVGGTSGQLGIFKEILTELCSALQQ